MKHIWPIAFVLALTACTEPASDPEAAPLEYLGIATQLLEGDLVNFHVEMRGATNSDQLERYARCAAAQYALIRGYGFARHVRTNIAEEGGLWAADAVYTISAALPRGLKTIDAEVTVSACKEDGIPTV